MSRQTTMGSRPVAVRFHEKDRSSASGLQFGTVEVLIDGHAPIERGYMPKIGAEAVARDLGVPLLLDRAFQG